MPVVRVDVSPTMLRWARARARLEREDLAKAFPKLVEWEQGKVKPTFKQLEAFAHRVHVPVGYLFLPTPPDERLPIPDYRTIGNSGVEQPSADLLDTIYACQNRQGWYRDFSELNGDESLDFVGSIAVQSDVVRAGRLIRDALKLTVEARQAARTWEDALRQMVAQAEDLGVLVMRNGVVGNNTHRKLNPDEFRGFALTDRLAPLVFINAADSKSAQMFTLAHELVHVFTNREGVSDASPQHMPNGAVEQWCNNVAAEVLVPRQEFIGAYRPSSDLESELLRLARVFKVSTLVILRRVYDVGGLSREAFGNAYGAEVARLQTLVEKRQTNTESGGDFHLTEAVRVGRRFAKALVSSTLEGRTLYRDAFKLLDIKKVETFTEFGISLGVAI